MTGPEADSLDEVLLSEAAVLFELDAARAEAWASGLLADWTDHDELLASLERATAPAALAVAVALTPMLPAAATVVAHRTARGDEPPDFAPHVGTAVPVGAWAIHDRHGTGTSIVVEYVHADGVRHDMLAELDAGVAVDLLVGPPGVVDTAREAEPDAGDRRLEIEAVEPDDALARIRAGMQRVLDGETAWLTEAYLLNYALVASRVGLPVVPPDVTTAVESSEVEADPADAEADARARATLAAALSARLAAPPPDDAIAAAAAAWRAAFARGDDDALSVAADARVDGDESDRLDDRTLLVRLAGAYVARRPRISLVPAAAEAVDALEWADWLGAVIQLVRAGVGADASPDQLVRNINRCPEVTTSIPKRDAPAVASAFECSMPAWRVTGAVDGDDRLTELGAWLLPRALAAAWGATPGEV